jgi:hypothetical protein
MASKIKQVTLKKEETFIGYVTSEQPRDANQVVNDKNQKKSDLPRHDDFNRAADKMKPHLLIACGFQLPQDCNGNYLQKIHFDDFFADTEDEADHFGGLELTGILIQGKHAADGVQLFGTKVAPNGDIVKIKTPPIDLKRVVDGYNYPLLDILDIQLDTFLHEAQQYHERKKHGAGLQTAIEMPIRPDINTTKKQKELMASGE